MTHSPDPSFLKDEEDQTAASEGDLFVLPTSFAQQRLWLLDELESGSAYNIQCAWRLTGRINCPIQVHPSTADQQFPEV